MRDPGSEVASGLASPCSAFEHHATTSLRFVLRVFIAARCGLVCSKFLIRDVA